MAPDVRNVLAADELHRVAMVIFAGGALEFAQPCARQPIAPWDP